MCFLLAGEFCLFTLSSIIFAIFFIQTFPRKDKKNKTENLMILFRDIYIDYDNNL